MGKLNVVTKAGAVFLMWATAAVALPAQTTPSTSAPPVFTTLLSLDGTDGAIPDASLVQATDGNLCGTTNDLGANNNGTVFKITPRGTLTTLYNFCSQDNCTDGANPSAGLVQGTGGSLYGTTIHGGGLQLVCLRYYLWHSLQNYPKRQVDDDAQLRRDGRFLALRGSDPIHRRQLLRDNC